ncbi:hypothetical protein Taro_026052 [Colocasia esculenta]|uniref:Uncharacterized protein n=1 Tax=Colocasia esculenta TaxID=4460 RepID=A0A843VE35_COLES|nr:hypothetical protein [Colocasia esculenta]
MSAARITNFSILIPYHLTFRIVNLLTKVQEPRDRDRIGRPQTDLIDRSRPRLGRAGPSPAELKGHLNSLVRYSHGHYLDLGDDQYVGDSPLSQKTFDLLAMPDEIVL